MASEAERVAARFGALQLSLEKEKALVKRLAELERAEEVVVRSVETVRSALQNTVRGLSYFADIDPKLEVVLVGLGKLRNRVVHTSGRMAFYRLVAEASALKEELAEDEAVLTFVRSKLLTVHSQFNETSDMIRVLRESLSQMIGVSFEPGCDCQRRRRQREAGGPRRRYVTEVVLFESTVGKSFICNNIFFYKV